MHSDHLSPRRITAEQDAQQLRPAIYLRCYPHDRWQMMTLRHALLRHADRLGALSPTVYFDNGRRARETRPELEHMIENITQGQHRLVLVPGPWVFALDSAEAQSIAQRITQAGGRIMEVPSPRASASGRRSSSADRRPPLNG
ncbi:hypothetical protein [Streptomyces sp. NPDC049887]|uniref:hypothetical protein n=1 Tax=unclassified Streptomyces TaxID=2593676 RepID=UPI003428E954